MQLEVRARHVAIAMRHQIVAEPLLHALGSAIICPMEVLALAEEDEAVASPEDGGMVVEAVEEAEIAR